MSFSSLFTGIRYQPYQNHQGIFRSSLKFFKIFQVFIENFRNLKILSRVEGISEISVIFLNFRKFHKHEYISGVVEFNGSLKEFSRLFGSFQKYH
jgi:hypothetical protein